MNHIQRLFVVLFSGLMLSSAGCSVSVYRPASLSVPLAMRPTQDSAGMLSLPGRPLKVYLEPVDDNRANKSAIGENREENTPVPIYATDLSPAQWVHDSMQDQLRTAGVNIVTDPALADRRIRITLTEFWAEESPSYKAWIAANVEVRDSTGKVVWQSGIRGEDGTFGHSLSIENYQQVLSNSLVACAKQLLSNPGFGQSISGTP